MKKIRIDGREYNVSKKVYEYIKGVSAEKRLYKQELQVYGKRTAKEIAKKVDEIYRLIEEGKLEKERGLTVVDALSWVLGEEYLDRYPYVEEKEGK